MTRLYELSTELATINDKIISADGEITPDLEAQLDSVALDFRVKSQNIAKWTLDIAGTEAMIQAEIERLQRKKKVAENLRTRLATYVKACMEQADVPKIESPTITLRLQKNPPSVEIVAEDKIPAKFVRIKQVTEINKTEILTALKSGEDVPGTRLITEKTHLRIK
jgi:hypothetical protein